MMTRKILTWSCAVVAGAAILVPQRASATLTLGLGNSGISPTYPSPYGTVAVTLLDSTHADVTFTPTATASPGGWHYFIGGAQMADLNVNGAFQVVGDLGGFTGTSHFASPGPVTGIGPGNADG